MYLGNNVVKTPEWTRDDYEMRAKDIAHIEPLFKRIVQEPPL